MKYNNKMVISLILLTLLSTGCVKPTEEVNSVKSNGDNSLVYDEQPATVTYDNSTPIIYADPTSTTTTSTATTVSSNGIYGTPTDNTIIATDHYQPAMGQVTTTTTSSNNIYGTSTTTIPSSGNEIYTGGSNIYTSNSGNINNTSSYYDNIDDPYTNSGSSNSYGGSYSYPSHNSYSSSTSNTNRYGSYSSYSNSSSSSGGVELQVAAFKDYYSAQEFKNNLSLPPKYTAYIKRGAMNKVIIKGFSSRAEAKALASRQFPGAFIVSGSSSSSSYSSSTPSYSSGSSSSYHLNYTTNTSYSTPSTSTYTNKKIGVQVGAFSSKAKALSVAKSKAGGKYKAVVKKATVRGRTVYKAIIVGFSSRAEAKKAIASGRFGDAFVVSL